MGKRERLLKLIKQFPEKTRRDLVYEPYGKEPRSLNVVYLEVKMDTKLGRELAKEML